MTPMVYGPGFHDGRNIHVKIMSHQKVTTKNGPNCSPLKKPHLFNQYSVAEWVIRSIILYSCTELSTRERHTASVKRAYILNDRSRRVVRVSTYQPSIDFIYNVR